MKDVRQIKPVSVYDGSSEEYKISLNEFDNEPSYYKANIQPMLAVGHEGELLNWLQSIGVLHKHQTCDNIINDVPCNGIMAWAPAKVIDHYQLKCKKCPKKDTIRSKSVFQDTKCHFRDIIRLLVGWCKATDDETMSKLLNIKRQTVLKVYDIVAQLANKYVITHISKWRIGGPDKIILIDTYPEGLLKYENNRNTLSKTFTPILCIMEVQSVPQRYWIHVLDRSNIHHTEQLNNVNLAALEVIKNMVLPGSLLIANSDAKICSFDVIQALKHLYPVTVTLESLERHNTIVNDVLDNLEVIWQPVIDVCHEAYKYTNNQMQNFIISCLWQQQFQSEAFEMLLNQMCYNFS